MWEKTEDRGCIVWTLKQTDITMIMSGIQLDAASNFEELVGHIEVYAANIHILEVAPFGKFDSRPIGIPFPEAQQRAWEIAGAIGNLLRSRK